MLVLGGSAVSYDRGMRQAMLLLFSYEGRPKEAISYICHSFTGQARYAFLAHPLCHTRKS